MPEIRTFTRKSVFRLPLFLKTVVLYSGLYVTIEKLGRQLDQASYNQILAAMSLISVPVDPALANSTTSKSLLRLRQSEQDEVMGAPIPTVTSKC